MASRSPRDQWVNAWPLIHYISVNVHEIPKMKSWPEFVRWERCSVSSTRSRLTIIWVHMLNLLGDGYSSVRVCTTRRSRTSCATRRNASRQKINLQISLWVFRVGFVQSIGWLNFVMGDFDFHLKVTDCFLASVTICCCHFMNSLWPSDAIWWL